MTRPALDCPRPAPAPVAPVAPVFLNFRSQIVRPVCFAIVYWDGPGDTLYAFEDRDAFERQRTTAERHFVHVHELSAEEAADWISRRQRRPPRGIDRRRCGIRKPEARARLKAGRPPP